MKHRINTALPALVIAAASGAARAQSYTLTALPLLPGGDESVAYDMNNTGVITGEAVYSNQHRYRHAVRWTGGIAADLGQVAGAYSHGFSINDAGTVAGACEVGAGFSTTVRGMYRTTAGAMTALPGTFRSQAQAINASGQIVGSNGNGQIIAEQPVTVAAIWNPPGYTAQNLGSLGGRYAEAVAINDSGMIAGRSLLLNGPMHAFSKAPQGAITDLGTLGGPASEANALNNAGRIVGWAELPSRARHAAAWDGTTIADLGTLPGAAASEALAINTGGDIVGTSWVAGQGPRAWVLRAGGNMTDLNALIPAGSGWVLQYARGINDGGQIVGQGRLAGKMRAFLLTPSGCYANCDFSTLTPVLNVADFTCFLQRFAAGDSYANCDNSTTPPTLNVADFTCFLQQFAAGCP